MSVNNGTISAPINYEDPYQCMGVAATANGYDLTYICSNAHGKTNRWSKYKPVRYNTPGDLTKDNFIAAKCGLSPSQPLTVLKGACVPNAVATPTSKTVAEVKAQISEYEYLAPRVGIDFSRNNDFINYNHKTTPPDSGAKDLSVQMDTFGKYTNEAQTISTDGSNPYNWAVTSPALYVFSNIGIKLGEGSNENINFVGSSDAIPLPWIFANANNCRLGLAIRISTTVGSFAAGNWILFVGRKTLNSGNVMADMMPSISTNMRAYVHLATNFNNKVNSFDAIPVLVENLIVDMYAMPNGGGTKLQTQLSITAATNIYAMPSGAGACQFTITKGNINPSIPGANCVYTENGWTLATIFTGQYAQIGSGSQNKYPVNVLAIIKPAAVPTTQTLYLTYRTSTNTSGGNISYNDVHDKQVVVSAGATFTYEGRTFYGSTINAGPGMTLHGYGGIEDNFGIIIK